MKRLIAFAAIAALTLSALGCAQRKGENVPAEHAAPADTATGIIMPPPADTSWAGSLTEAEFKALHAPPTGLNVQLHGIDLDLAGGKAYLSLPSGAPPFPGLVVVHEWWGLNDHIKHWSDRLAREGYAALAVDLYEGKVTSSPDEAMQLKDSIKEPRALQVLAAAHDFLEMDPRVKATKTGSIGWCMGGAWSLNLAINEPDLDAAVIYYGPLVEDPAQLSKIKAKLCAVFGNQDKIIPPSAVDAFEKALATAGVDHEIHRYDAEHAFANPSNPIYDEKNSAAAWEVTRSFLARNLK
jgi:carboxymethylenebutenolidase